MTKLTYSFFLLLISLSLTSLKVITTDDLTEALAQVKPGDTIELKSGAYNNVPYSLKNGTEGMPIKIKPAPNAYVNFIGVPSKCIFNAERIHHVTIEGPMLLGHALCGLKLMNSTYVNISRLMIVNMQQHAILISGDHNTIYNNKIYDCVMENKDTARTKSGGWNQCVAIWGVGYERFSYNNSVLYNTITWSYGEGLYLLKCNKCQVSGNEITNSVNMNIYIDSSKNINITENILRVNSTQFNTKWGKACGIGMSPESERENITNIVIVNNIIIGTRIGIYFFTLDAGGSYNRTEIECNTLWNIEYTPILFKKPTTLASNCRLANNFIYFSGAVEFEPKYAWYMGYNIFYNTSTVPSIYSGENSKAAKQLDLATVFNKKQGCDDYYNPDLKIECLRPSKQPGELQLFQSGYATSGYALYDFYGCRRKGTSISIGAYEYTEACYGGIDPPDTDVPVGEYNVRFNITYCTSGSRIIKLVGTNCLWNVGKCPELILDKNCAWYSPLFKNIEDLNFVYKFAVVSGSDIYKWESNPNRKFNGGALLSLVKKSPTGNYEDCKYSLIDNTITLVCYWK